MIQQEKRPQLWRTARVLLAPLLMAIAAWLSLRQVRWAIIAETLSAADWPMAGLALLTVAATTSAKAARWLVLLRQCGAQCRFGRTWRLLFVSQLGNMLMPARFGDGARAVLIGPQTPGGIPAALGTIVGEKTFDGIAGTAVLVVLALLTPLPAWARGPILGTAGLTGCLVALLLLLGSRPHKVLRAVDLLTGWLPGSFRSPLRSILANLAQAMGLVSRGTGVTRVAFWTAVVWSLAALTNALVLLALHIQAPAWSVLLVLAIVYAAGFLPTAPVQLGVFEYACVLALTTAGVQPESALSFGLVLHMLVLTPPALLGPVAMAAEGLRWSHLRKPVRS